MPWGRGSARGALLVLVAGAACVSTPAGPGRSSPPPPVGAVAAPPATATTVALAAPPAPPPGPVRVAARVERHVGDPATADFAAVVRATLVDPRGWRGAGFEFTFADDAPYRIVLADGPEVDGLCRPYDVGGRFSCQNGPVVALNAERWRSATPQWTGDLDAYRRMLVNHEVGHLLGQHHPAVQCPAPGRPAPVMAQQSTELHGCVANPWPLPWELDCAARHQDPIAPGYDDQPAAVCRPPG